MRPGDIVRLDPGQSPWWGLNLERLSKVHSDLTMCTVIYLRRRSSTFSLDTGPAGPAYNVLLLTRDRQLIWMREEMLELM